MHNLSRSPQPHAPVSYHMEKGLAEAKYLIPRWGKKRIAIHEVGETGLGDRLRGIAVALFLARWHRASVIDYDDESDLLNHDERWSVFPYKLHDLIDIEGIEFNSFNGDPKKDSIHVRHYCGKGMSIKRYGFSQMKRLKPRNPAVIKRIQEIGINQQCLGFHVRGTDAIDAGRYKEPVDVMIERTIGNVATCTKKLNTKKIFLAADNPRSIAEWSERLSKEGYDISYNDGTQWNEGEFRQTGAEDMLVDFFGLGHCGMVTRFVYSEFSRYAACMTGQTLAYRDLY